jgi:hypothetical protein
MACACGANKAKAATYVVTKPDGSKTSYSSEVEAAAAAKRVGGMYRKA